MPLQMPADEYQLIADLVNRLGERFVGGILLKSTLKTVILTCDECGTLEPPIQRGWPGGLAGYLSQGDGSRQGTPRAFSGSQGGTVRNIRWTQPGVVC